MESKSLIRELYPVFFMGGAVAGGAVGLVTGDVILASGIGIAVAVLAWQVARLYVRGKFTPPQ